MVYECTKEKDVVRRAERLVMLKPVCSASRRTGNRGKKWRKSPGNELGNEKKNGRTRTNRNVRETEFAGGVTSCVASGETNGTSSRMMVRTTALDESVSMRGAMVALNMSSPVQRKHSVSRVKHSDKHALRVSASSSSSSDAITDSNDGADIGDALVRSVASASLAGILFGYHIGVVNGALEKMAASIGIAESAVRQGIVVSMVLAGALVGSAVASSISEKLGRRGTLVGGVVPLTMLGAALVASASSFAAVTAGRFITGIGVGIASAVLPSYIGEISPRAIRGELGSVTQVSICAGILIAVLAGLAFQSWRSLFVLAAVISGLLATLIACPESPTWLTKNGKHDAAAAAASALWGRGATDKPAALAADKADEEESAAAVVDGNDNAGAPTVFAPRYRHGLVVGVVLFIVQQLSGINAVVYFSTSIFAAAGMQNGALASALVATTNLLVTIVAARVMDRAGRRRMLLVSFLGMAVSMTVLAGMLSPYAASIVASSAGGAAATYASALTVLAAIGFIGFFALGVGPVPSLLVSELFANNTVRSGALSVCMSVHWLLNTGVGLLFLPAITSFGTPACFLFFAAMSFVGAAFVAGFILETSGKSFEQVEAEYAAASEKFYGGGGSSLPAATA